MKIYHYKEDTKEFLREVEARLDLLESQQQGKDVFIIPAKATDKKPPTIGVNQQAVFDGLTWGLVKDFRGAKYYLTDGTEMTVQNLDEEIPVGLPITPRPSRHYDWDGTEWVLNQASLDAEVVYEQKQADAAEQLTLNDLANKTYTQIETYIDNNVTNLASQIAFDKKIAKIILAMLKKMDLSD